MMALCEEMDSCVSNPTSSTKMVSSEEGIVSGVASEKSLKGKSHDIKLEALESSREVNTICIIPHKTPQGYARPISSVKPEKVSETSYSNALALVPSQEGRTPPMTPENAPQKPDSSVHTLQSGQEGSNSSVVREKTLDDGYNWRKYGQKNVKGNEYIRSYYRCTHRNCQVKRQVERSHDGQITDTVYFGEHDHPKSQGNLPLAVGIVVSIVEDRSADPSATIVNDKYSIHRKTPNQVAHLTVAGSDDVKTELSNGRRDKTDNNDVPDTKRQKKDYFYASPLGKSMGKQSHVVKTMSEVDAVSDGYRWRKYGQKLVKGNPNPRSYYRCSSSGCPVKKHVERASHDPKMVVATYEGQHDHDMPPCRTVTYTMVGQNDQMSPQDGETGTELRDYEAVCLDMVVHSSSDHHGTVEENSQTTANAGELGTKTREHNAVCLDMVVHRSSDSHDSLPRKNQTHSTARENTKATSQDGESNSKRKESDTIAPDVAIHASSGVANKSDERPNGDSETKSEVYDSIAVHSSPDGGSRQSNKLKTNKSGDNSEENNTVGLNTAGPENGSTGPVIERATNIKSRSCP